MVNQIYGKLAMDADTSIAIVASRFNDLITRRLADGAMECLVRHGVSQSQITLVWVPGAFEIPLAASQLANSGKHNGVICLGAVIQGQTTHHEYINSQVAAAIMNLSLSTGLPVTFGLLTCENTEQALNRAGGKVGNKGEEAALAALEMIDVLKTLRS
jgi:6,7-dimethyl-8-ribityllumazine synthase